jgi:hypothetical protein
MSNSRIVYRARDDATTEAEMSVLVAIYKLCLERSHAKKEATRPGSPDDAKERFENDSSARTIIPDK